MKNVLKAWRTVLTACVGFAPSLAIAQLAQGSPPPDIDAVRVVAALIVSLLVGFAAIWFLKAWLLPGRRSALHPSIKIVESVRLGGRAMLHAIEFDGRRILVATDSGSIVLLAEGGSASRVETVNQ